MVDEDSGGRDDENNKQINIDLFFCTFFYSLCKLFYSFWQVIYYIFQNDLTNTYL